MSENQLLGKIMPKTTYILLLIIVSSVYVTGCEETKKEEPYPVVTSKYLKKPNISDKPLPTMKLIKHYDVISVHSCESLFKKLGEFKLVETPNNLKIFWDYIPCVAGKLLDKAKSSQQSAYNNNFQAIILEDLDLLSFNSSLRPQLSKTTNTFKTLGFKISNNDNTVVLFETKDWKFQWTLLARGDFNADGIEDLLVRFLDQAKTSNYFSAQLLILQSNDTDKPWSAKPGLQLLK